LSAWWWWNCHFFYEKTTKKDALCGGVCSQGKERTAFVGKDIPFQIHTQNMP